MDTLTDAELVPHLNEMCPAAWRELYRRYWRYIRKVALNENMDYGSLEDIEQDCLLFLVALVPDLKPESLRPLIAVVTKNAVRAEKHQQQKILRAAGLDWRLSAGPTQIQAIEEETCRNAVMELLETVTKKELEVILPVYYQGYTPKEAGEKLNIAEKQVRKRILAARTRMARRLALEKFANLLIPDEVDPQGHWPTVSDPQISLYFCNKRNREKRRAKKAATQTHAT
jgi:RNA polymerase sigma factor (sigma-70 family)